MKLYFYFLSFVSRNQIKLEAEEIDDKNPILKQLLKGKGIYNISISREPVGYGKEHYCWTDFFIILDKKDDDEARRIFIKRFRGESKALNNEISELKERLERKNEIVSILEEMEDEENGQI